MYISFTLFVYQKKSKISVLLLFKNKLLCKLSFDDESFTKLRLESEKTIVEWFWLSASVSQTCEVMPDFKAC